MKEIQNDFFELNLDMRSSDVEPSEVRAIAYQTAYRRAYEEAPGGSIDGLQARALELFPDIFDQLTTKLRDKL